MGCHGCFAPIGTPSLRASANIPCVRIQVQGILLDPWKREGNVQLKAIFVSSESWLWALFLKMLITPDIIVIFITRSCLRAILMQLGGAYSCLCWCCWFPCLYTSILIGGLQQPLLDCSCISSCIVLLLVWIDHVMLKLKPVQYKQQLWDWQGNIAIL